MQENLKQKSRIMSKSKFFILISLFICIFSCVGLGASAEITEGALIKETFPDSNFRTYICRDVLGRDGDIDEMTFIDTDADKIKGRTEIDLLRCYSQEGRFAASFEGIKEFTSLTTLNCGNCSKLTSLDLSGCTSLTTLTCGGCYALTSLDLSECTSLTTLKCGSCSALTSLDLSGFTNLTTLQCTYCTGLTNLNVSGCTSLTELNCDSFKALTSLNVSGCTNLESLSCSQVKITSLDVGTCESLKTLDCSSTEITSLDVSACTALTNLNCSSCTELMNLNVSGCTSLTTLDCSSCSKLTSLTLSGCTALTDLICNSCEVLVSPDLSDCTSLTTLEFYSCYGFTSLDVSNCTSLTTLICSNCSNLMSLDVSSCTSLTNLNCGGCYALTSLNISGCTSLTTLDCNSCSELTSLELSGYTSLTTLNCVYCSKLTSLGLSGCTSLTTLSCSSTALTSLDLSECTSLTELDCGSCKNMTNLNVRGCTSLKNLDCASCSVLTSLNISGCTSLTTLDCNSCSKLTSPDLSGCTNLTRLDCRYCYEFTSLNVSGYTSLQGLLCEFCSKLTSLNVSGCTKLTNLLCKSCSQLQSLNASGSSGLNQLNLQNNGNLKELNVSNCPLFTKIVSDSSTVQNGTLRLHTSTSLTKLICSNCTKLTILSIPRSNGSNNTIENIDCSNCPMLPQLDVSACTALTTLNCSGCALDGIDLSGKTLNPDNVDLGKTAETCQSIKKAVHAKKGGKAYIDGPAAGVTETTTGSIIACYNAVGEELDNTLADYDANNNEINILDNNVEAVLLSVIINGQHTMHIKYSMVATVSYDPNGGKFSKNNSETPIAREVPRGAAVAEYIPTGNSGDYAVRRDGYEFAEWCIDPIGTTNVNGFVRIYPKWHVIKKLIFNLNESGVNKSQLLVSGSNVADTYTINVTETKMVKAAMDSKVITVTRPGYTFTGWTLDQEGKRPLTNDYAMLARDVTIYAQWTANEYNLTLDVNADALTNPEEGAVIPTNREPLTVKTDERIQTVLERAGLSKEVYECSGYKQIGWTIGNNGTKRDLKYSDIMPPNNYTIYTKWKRFSSAMNEDLYISEVFIGDNFRSQVYSKVLKRQEPAGGELFSEADINAIRSATYLDISNRNISDLSGLSNFENLITLECSSNNITDLDVSKIKTLKYLTCSSNDIKTLNLGETPTLNRITISGCGLNELDVSMCNELTNLVCDNNNLTNLDLSSNTKLKVLECQKNKLTSLNLAANAALINLNCSNNNINNIDLSSNTALENTTLGPQNLYLEIKKDQGSYYVDLGAGISTPDGQAISGYDISTGRVTWDSAAAVNNFNYNCNTNNGDKTMQVNVESMASIVLDANGGIFTTTKSPDNITIFHKVGTTNVDLCNEITKNSNYAVNHPRDIFVAWRPQGTTTPTLDGDGCRLRVDWIGAMTGSNFGEIFPDASFRNFVINRVLSTEVGLTEKSTITAKHQQMLLGKTELDLSGKGIKDLTGIEYFANLENLDCRKNNLQELTVSSLEALTTCTCDNQTANPVLNQNDDEQWEVQLLSGLTDLTETTGKNQATYDQDTGRITWPLDAEYTDEQFTYTYSYDLANGETHSMNVTVIPSMSLIFNANGGNFRNGTPEPIAIPMGAKIKDYLANYDKKTYEPIHTDSNLLFSSWSKTAGDYQTQTKITDTDTMDTQELTLYAIWVPIVEKIKEVATSNLSAVTLIQASTSSADKTEEEISNMTAEEKTTAIAETLGKTENKETYTQAIETVAMYVGLQDDSTMDAEVKEHVEVVKSAIAEVNHKDTTHNVSVAAAGEGESLDWNIKVNVEPKEIVKEEIIGTDETLDEVLNNGSALVSFDISLATVSVNDEGVLDETKYEPEAGKKIKLIVPSPIEQEFIDFGFDVTYIHFKSDGTIETFSIYEGTLNPIGDGLLELEVDAFSEWVGTPAVMRWTVTFDLNDTTAEFAEEELIYILAANQIYAELGEDGTPMNKGEEKVDGTATVTILAGKMLQEGETVSAIAGEPPLKILNRTAIKKAPAGKMFYKWNTKADGKGTFVEPGSEVDTYILATKYAKEYETTAAKLNKKMTLYATWVLAGDFNGDGKVDDADYQTYMETYGKFGNNLPGDVMSIGCNNLSNYAVLKQYYTNSTPSEET